MENASKALIIAGAILLAIVIISLGLVVVNNTRGVSDNANLSEQEIQSFNAKFTPYIGENISGSKVNTLIQQVISTNQSLYEDGKIEQMINIGFKPVNYKSSSLYLKHSKTTVDILGKLIGPSNPIDLSGITPDNQGTDSGYKKLDDLATKPSLSVSTGSSYTITVEYKEGLIKGIAVK